MPSQILSSSLSVVERTTQHKEQVEGNTRLHAFIITKRPKPSPITRFQDKSAFGPSLCTHKAATRPLRRPVPRRFVGAPPRTLNTVLHTKTTVMGGIPFWLRKWIWCKFFFRRMPLKGCLFMSHSSKPLENKGFEPEERFGT